MKQLAFLFCWMLGVGDGYLAWSQGGELLFHHLRVQDGLSQAVNFHMYKDQRGFVWISSMAGLNRFDGHQVRTYIPDRTDPCALVGENIQSNFFEDSTGAMWFCTYEVLQQYDWATDCFSSYQLLDSAGQGLTGYYIFHLDPSQRLWIVLDRKKLYTYHIPSGTFRLEGDLKHEAIKGVAIENAEGIVERVVLYGFGTPGIQVMEMDETKDNWLPLVMYWDKNPHTNQQVNQVLIEGDSVLWALTKSRIIRRHWASGQEREMATVQSQTMTWLNDTTILMGFLHDGMKEFSTRRFEWSRAYLPEEGNDLSLINLQIHHLHRDRDQGIWASSQGVGISFAHPQKKKFDTFYPGHEVPLSGKLNPVKLAEHSPSEIWCFTVSNGVLSVRYNEHHRYDIQPVKELTAESIGHLVLYVVQDRQSNYWIVTWGGVLHFDSASRQLTRVSDATTVPLSGFEMNDGRMIFNVLEKGVYEAVEHHPGSYSLQLMESITPGLNYHPLWQDASGRMWVGENLVQFRVLDAQTHEVLKILDVRGLVNQIIQSRDSSVVWIASNSGLHEIDALTLEIKNVYTENNGLPAKGINNLLIDDTGQVWLTHYNGIIAFSPETGKSRAYTNEDGLPWWEFTASSCQTRDGEMWVGSIDGITHFYPDRIQDLQVKAIPQISEILINDARSPERWICEQTGATHITEIKKLTFDYRQNTLSFLVHALEYSAPAFNKVWYKMEGLDEGEIEIASGSRIRYSNIPPGHYQFIMYAVNSDGIRNPEPRIFQIRILPPFYKTWWFVSLVVLMVILIIAYIVYLRFSKALELQKVRLKLYENLHDDVGSRLTAIVLSAEDLERQNQIQHPKITAISQIARSIVGNMRRLVWAIDPENDRMYNIVQKIQHDRSILLSDQIGFQLDIEENLVGKVIPGELRYQMNSISSEAFTNIAKYAEATAVHVQISRQKGSISMRIHDDGRGFDPEDISGSARSGSGYGLTNMKRRAARVGGELTVDSAPGQGTTITFTFPFR